jgi:hypothetical protein
MIVEEKVQDLGEYRTCPFEFSTVICYTINNSIAFYTVGRNDIPLSREPASGVGSSYLEHPTLFILSKNKKESVENE